RCDSRITRPGDRRAAGTGDHASKLVKHERPASLPDTRCPMEDGSRRRHADRDRDQREKRRQKNQAGGGADDVENARHRACCETISVTAAITDSTSASLMVE